LNLYTTSKLIALSLLSEIQNQSYKL